MEVVKYTRKQYREEFLKSEEWKNFRLKFLEKFPDCFKCKNPALDLHHIIYPTGLI